MRVNNTLDAFALRLRNPKIPDQFKPRRTNAPSKYIIKRGKRATDWCCGRALDPGVVQVRLG